MNIVDEPQKLSPSNVLSYKVLHVDHYDFMYMAKVLGYMHVLSSRMLICFYYCSADYYYMYYIYACTAYVYV